MLRSLGEWFAMPVTKKAFDAFSPRSKGYAVYMAGERKDQPNIPKIWVPPDEESRVEYDKGQAAAVLEVQDVG